MDQQMQDVIEQVYTVLATYGLDVIGALVIIILGFVAAGWARRAVEKAFSRSKRADPTLSRFFGSLVKYAVIAFVVIAALQQFGVEATSLVAVFGAAGLAIGLREKDARYCLAMAADLGLGMTIGQDAHNWYLAASEEHGADDDSLMLDTVAKKGGRVTG